MRKCRLIIQPELQPWTANQTAQNCKDTTLQAGQVALVDAQHYIIKSTFEKV